MSELTLGRLLSAGRYRSSESRLSEAGTAGLTRTRKPVTTQALWLGANRGARRPSLISRVTANRLREVAGKNRRVLSAKFLRLSSAPCVHGSYLPGKRAA